MCGLVGIAGDTTGGWKDLFSELLLIDSVRGMHSTGAGFVGRYDEVFSLAKRPGNPFNLLHTDDYEKCLEINSPQKVMIGHNRFATIGEHTQENAHPFAFKHIMGAHNGTLDKYCISDLHNHDKFGTDSEAIFATINELNLSKTMEKVTGAWALTYFDKRDNTLNFLRNNRRPLYYCYSFDRCTLIWASESEMLRYVMGRKGKKMDKDEIYVTEPDLHYSWCIPSVVSKKIDAPTTEKVEGRNYTYYAPFKHGTYKAHNQGSTSSTTGPSTGSNDNIIPFSQRADTSKFRTPYKDQYGHVLKKEGFVKMVENGCAFCGTQEQAWGTFVHVLGAWTGPNSTPYVCEWCYNDADTFETLNYAM